MTNQQLEQALRVAEQAARHAGSFLKARFECAELHVDERLAHDIKLRLDKEAQQCIEDILLTAYPDDALLGEEGTCAKKNAEAEWIVDPIDGTVNFFYGIPLFCVSIALRYQGRMVLGCVYEPMRDECYKAIAGQVAYCNERVIRVSERALMAEAVVFIGHGRHDKSGEVGMARFARISAQVCKMRILGTAALSLCYIAAGRMDAYVEHTLSLWDFAAAQVILEAAGGRIEFTPRDAYGLKGQIVAWNARLPISDWL